MGIRTIMHQTIKIILIILYLTIFNNRLFADPWFTGPILAPAGHTVPRGYTNLEIYGLDVHTTGQYDQNGNVLHTPLFRTYALNPLLTHGFTDWLDVQLAVPYAWNTTLGQSAHHLSDVSAALGIQLFEQKKSPSRVDVRLLLQETIPTGRYEHLNPALDGTDATGLGSYQTQVGLNFQYLMQVFKTHYLRTRFILSRIFYSPVKVNGLNSFGGTLTTHGTVDPGSEYDADLAFEYTLTQNWVAVMEGYISRGNSSRFNGVLKLENVGNLTTTTINNGTFNETALAPALEYNFNENIGIIGGVWFPVSGKNTSYYMTYVLALNAVWG